MYFCTMVNENKRVRKIRPFLIFKRLVRKCLRVLKSNIEDEQSITILTNDMMVFTLVIHRESFEESEAPSKMRRND